MKIEVPITLHENVALTLSITERGNLSSAVSIKVARFCGRFCCRCWCDQPSVEMTAPVSVCSWLICRISSSANGDKPPPAGRPPVHAIFRILLRARSPRRSIRCGKIIITVIIKCRRVRGRIVPTTRAEVFWSRVVNYQTSAMNN
jgi:hypothetical protein